jgi:L-ascorbate metabolism protein UlaG (beta-lactamase superfamily)
VKITRFSHSCVRIELEHIVLVIDPGIWSEPSASLDADAILVTHEHVDHIDELRLLGLGVPVYAPAGAAITRVAFEPVEVGQSFTSAGVTVRAVGGQHAAVVADQSTCKNLGYVVADVYHPGDALGVVDQQIDVLLVPMQASWLKTAEAIEFMTRHTYRRAYGIHDGQINGRAIESINHWYARASDGRYEYLPPGTTRETGK